MSADIGSVANGSHGEDCVEDCVVIIKPHACMSALDIIHTLPAACIVTASTSTKLSEKFVQEFYANHAGKWFFPRLKQSMTTGNAFVMKIRTASIGMLREWIGPTDPAVARKECPRSVRAVWGSELPNNAIHCSDCAEEAQREVKIVNAFYFGPLEETLGSDPQQQ
jgi:nucleoside diphosphate kinase